MSGQRHATPRVPAKPSPDSRKPRPFTHFTRTRRRRAWFSINCYQVADHKGLTLWQEPVAAPGRKCGAFASCGASETCWRGTMSELSDVGRLGARQTRRSASRARSDAPQRSGGAGDAAMRRDSSADGAGEAERGAGASEEGRDGLASVLENAKRGRGRGRSRAERFWTRRIRQDFDPMPYLCMASGRKDAVAARPNIASTVATTVTAT